MLRAQVAPCEINLIFLPRLAPDFGIGSDSDLDARDKQLATQRQSRAYIWTFDAEAEAEKAAASL